MTSLICSIQNFIGWHRSAAVSWSCVAAALWINSILWCYPCVVCMLSLWQCEFHATVQKYAVGWLATVNCTGCSQNRGHLMDMWEAIGYNADVWDGTDGNAPSQHWLDKLNSILLCHMKIWVILPIPINKFNQYFLILRNKSNRRWISHN